MIQNSKHEIFFAGQSSLDFNLEVINPKEITFPEKLKTTQALPFSNTILDISDLYGGQSYSERSIKFTFLVQNHKNVSKEALYAMWTSTVNWLMAPNQKVALVDDVMTDYYYLAEVQKAPTWDEYTRHGKFTVEFTCYPFRIYSLLEGNDDWDTFDLDNGFAQDTFFEIEGKRTIILYNVGQALANPQVIVSSNMTVQVNGQLYDFSAGTNENSEFVLELGENKLTITGNGTISFEWHKELI